MTTNQIAPDEPLSPELVLVLPPEQRAQILAALGPPVWPAPRARPIPLFRVIAPPMPVEEAPAPRSSLKRLVAARLVSLGVIFLTATVITLALSLVAHAIRTP